MKPDGDPAMGGTDTTPVSARGGSQDCKTLLAFFTFKMKHGLTAPAATKLTKCSTAVRKHLLYKILHKSSKMVEIYS